MTRVRINGFGRIGRHFCGTYRQRRPAYEVVAVDDLGDPDTMAHRSTDILRSPSSCVFDSRLTMTSGRSAEGFGRYDDEWGYSCRRVDVVGMLR